MLGETEGKRRRGWQRIRRLDSITDSMDMNLSKLQEIVEDRSLECFSPWNHMELLNNYTSIKTVRMGCGQGRRQWQPGVPEPPRSLRASPLLLAAFLAPTPCISHACSCSPKPAPSVAKETRVEVIRQIQSGQNTVLGSVSTPPIWDELLRADLPTFERPNRSPGPAIPLSVLESPSARNDLQHCQACPL